MEGALFVLGFLLLIGEGALVFAVWRLEEAFRMQVDAATVHTYPQPIRCFCGHDSATVVLHPGGVPFCPSCHEKGQVT